ncbi:MAG: hypothetical protein WCT10_04715 [Patescibacteria group bacterium]|jgi:hypothetical protein
MSLKTVIASVFALSLLAGCAPQARFVVPDGWKVAGSSDDAKTELNKQMLVGETEDDVIYYVVGPAKKYPLEVEVAQLLSILSKFNADIIERRIAPDKSSAKIVYTFTLGDGSQINGRCFLRESTRGYMTVGVMGNWPAEKDAAIVSAFEIIAASADYK